MRNSRFFLFAGLLAAAAPCASASVAPNPVSLVNAYIGTGDTPNNDVIDTFPGADVPFGMVQWSPDTPAQNAGGGYEYSDHDITGFSLTHLSGPGCSVFGDFGILPTTGPISDPAKSKQPFVHADENLAPGSYAVALGKPAIRTELTVTQRTGLGSFTYPATTQANLLFNVSSDQAGVSDASVHLIGKNEIEGSASSGFFCGMPDTFNVYFVAKFDRPFDSYGTWKNAQVFPGTPEANGPGIGAYVSFDTSHNAAIKVKVGLSFVDVAGARANLQKENSGWDLVRVRNEATRKWQNVLGRVAIEGGTHDEQSMFYTALYHALLHPNVFSDVTGLYPGFDGKPHRVTPGHVEYANFSDWDIYRTQTPLVALLAPREASDMMQSLVDAAKQDGWLPRWALANGATSVMGGDSVDPVIAGAYAFGARDFDFHSALAAMVKGAANTSAPPGSGWYVERPQLAEYLEYGYIPNTHTTSVSPVPNGASETLEYALDDFSIAQFAHQTGDAATYREYLRRSANWAKIFNTADGIIAPRDANGAFMHTPITDNGQSGFQEGNAAQYTWMVPQDLADLIRGMGGKEAAVRRLDAFFTQLDTGQDKPYAWLGNEPSLGSPWVYLSAGAPWRAQDVIHQTLTTLYNTSPAGIPGNDDLGTMSAWYVWAAMGLYPQNPAVRVLDIGAPEFTHVIITAPNGPVIDINAPQASAAAPYVQSLRLNGAPTQKSWITLPMHGTLHLDFALAENPNKEWGSAPEDAPPSYALGPVTFPIGTDATLKATTLSLTLAPGQSADFNFGLANQIATSTDAVTWQAQAPPGIRVQPDSGSLEPGGNATAVARISAGDNTAAGYYNVPIRARSSSGALLPGVTAIVRVNRPGAVAPLVYIENRFGNTVTPFDYVTGAVGPEIPTGAEPRDGVASPDGKRVYVTNRTGKSVSVIDTAKQSVIASVKVGQSPNGVRIAPDGKTLWLANNDDGTIQPIDTATLKAGDPIKVGANPRYTAISPDSATLYVSNESSNTISVIDLKTRTARTLFPAGRRPAGIAQTPDGSTLYVVDNATNEVTPIEVATGRALAAIHVGVGPVMIAITPDGKLAYVSNYASISVTPIDLTTNTARPPIYVGGQPYGIAFTPDGKTAIVVNRRDDACVTVDVRTGRISKPVLLGNGPYTIAGP